MFKQWGHQAALQGLNVTNSLFDRFNDYSIYPVIQVQLSSILNGVSLGSELVKFNLDNLCSLFYLENNIKHVNHLLLVILSDN